MDTQPTEPLLTPIELQHLERIRFTPHRRFAGSRRGERISRQKGISVEFSDYRDYSAGDDLRHLDWSILARLDRPTIRTYQDEDDLAVTVALDVSASMDFGYPSKFESACKLAAALGFVGLCGQDSVYAVALGSTLRVRAMRGRASYPALRRWAGGLTCGARTSLRTALTHIARSAQVRPGLLIVISDLLDPDAALAIRALGARGHEVVAIQLLSAIETDPEVEGDLRLIDSETDAVIEITAHAEALRIYKQNLERHCREIEEAATRAGGRYVRLIAGRSVSDFVSRDLRRAGVVE